MARTVRPAVQIDVVKEDPPDNRILECAVAAGSEFIVTGDKDLLRLARYYSIADMRAMIGPTAGHPQANFANRYWQVATGNRGQHRTWRGLGRVAGMFPSYLHDLRRQGLGDAIPQAVTIESYQEER